MDIGEEDDVLSEYDGTATFMKQNEAVCSGHTTGNRGNTQSFS